MLFAAALMTFGTIGFSSCGGDKDINEPTPVPVSSVTVSPNSIILIEGGTSMTVKAEVSPDNATDKSVTWSSSNESVATVSGGTITPKSAGSATITAKAGGRTATCEVTVKKATVSVTGVSLDKTTLELTEGESETLTATVMPDDATDKNVKWTTSDDKVATVEGGKVTAVKAGTAKITVTTEDGGKTATCDVTVKAATVSVTGVSLDKTTLELTEGESETLTAAVKPDNATNKNVTWKSSNDAVATVENGKVTAVKAGTAKITVTTNDGSRTATCDVTVKAAVISVTEVTLDKSTLEMGIGEKVTLNATVKPDDATNKKVTWESSAPLIASVTPDGLVTASAIGKATISVTSEDGSKSAKCEVTVKGIAVTGITLNVADKITMAVDGEMVLECKISPDNAENKNVKWTTSDNTKVKIFGRSSMSVYIQALALGSATITVTTEDGNHTAQCIVTVVAPADFAGSGTKADPYQISTRKDLETLATKVNSGTNYSDTYFKLMNDIDLGGSTSPWTPIGAVLKPFKGVFDGNSKVISGLFTDQPTLDHQSLFGDVDRCEIKNLSVIGSVVGSTFCGGIVGDASSSTITGCTSNVTVKGENFVGGIVGRAYSSCRISRCTNKGTAEGIRDVGGIVGGANNLSGNTSLISDCINSGAILGTSSVGGIVGESRKADIGNCSNSGAITANGKSSSSIGGIVGYTQGAFVVSCCNSGEISFLEVCFSIGGIVGSFDPFENITRGVVSSCYNTASVNGTGTIGGVVGENGRQVIACYNSGTVNGSSSGGIIGLHRRGTAIMSYCLNAADGGTDNPVGACYVTVGTDVKALSKAAMTDGTMLKDLNTAVDSYNSTKPTNAPTAIKFKAGTDGWPVF